MQQIFKVRAILPKIRWDSKNNIFALVYLTSKRVQVVRAFQTFALIWLKLKMDIITNKNRNIFKKLSTILYRFQAW